MILRRRALVGVLLLGLLSPHASAAPVKRLPSNQHVDHETRAISEVQRFVSYVNAGLPELASFSLTEEWRVGGQLYHPRQQLATFMANEPADPRVPMMIVAKRRVTRLSEVEVEVRCVVIWNITVGQKQRCRLISNERFVVWIGPDSAAVASAVAMPVVLGHEGTIAELERKLASVDADSP